MYINWVRGALIIMVNIHVYNEPARCLSVSSLEFPDYQLEPKPDFRSADGACVNPAVLLRHAISVQLKPSNTHHCRLSVRVSDNDVL